MKKYKDFLFLITITLGSQALIYFLIEHCITNFNIMHSFINVPLVKYFIYFYNLWYPFVLLVSFVVYKQNKSLFKYMIATMLLSTIMAHITFIAYPSMVERPTVEVNSFTDWILDFTYRCDTPAANCLPSVHCMYCFIIIYYIIQCKKLKQNYRLIIMTFSFIIILSTLFTKQHIIEDAILACTYMLLAVHIIELVSSAVKEHSFSISLQAIAHLLPKKSKAKRNRS